MSNPCIFQGNNKINEYVYKWESISGNPQRNYALTKCTNPNTLLYYLDDDNILLPNLYKLLDNIRAPGSIESFDSNNDKYIRLINIIE